MRSMTVLIGLALGLPLASQAPGRIAADETRSGELAHGDRVAEDSTYFDDYLITLRAGDRIEVRMRSDAFDTFSGIGAWNGSDMSEVFALDDDGEGDGSTNSRFRFTAQHDGDYVIRANALSVGGQGPYTLMVAALPPQPPADVHAIEIGGSVQGELSSADPTLDDTSYFEYWAFQARAGETYAISLASDAFDCYLVVGTLDGQVFTAIDANDDGEDGSTNSLLVITAPADGRLVIRANSFSGGETGVYTLSLRRGESGGIRKD